jgi:hypothetical protein
VTQHPKDAVLKLRVRPMVKETSKGALCLRNIAILLLILLPVSALGARFGLWHFRAGMLLCAGTVLGSLILQVISVVWLLRKPTVETKKTLRWVGVFALPPLIVAAIIMLGGEGPSVPIHNISTDLENPPQFITAEKVRGVDSNPLEYSAETAEIQRVAFPLISSINRFESADQSFQRSVMIARKMGWNIYHQGKLAGIIEAVDTTFWFGFKDDIVIRVQSTANGSQVDLRSVSRVGRGDRGVNAHRIAKFIRLFNVG